jgi:hypothetical protein
LSYRVQNTLDSCTESSLRDLVVVCLRGDPLPAIGVCGVATGVAML